MKAIAKVRAAPGADLIDIDPPAIKPGHVRVRVLRTSVCGTDVHIYDWDEWSQSRIHPPRVLGHEMCGIVEEVGEGVVARKVGDFVASESHIVCGHCVQCRAGQGHVCANTQILGVDVDGVFSPEIVIPEANAKLTDPSISPEVATCQDPLGNAVHTAMAGPIQDCNLLVTGAGPIGLFSIGVCRAAGARQIIATEISPYRRDLACKMGADVALDPMHEDVESLLAERTRGIGVDGVLEMSGHPASLDLAIRAVRPGGRISLLGIFHEQSIGANFNQVIFKGVDLQGIIGRRLDETWRRMQDLLASGRLDIRPAITHTFHYTEMAAAMELIKRGDCGKVVFTVS